MDEHIDKSTMDYVHNVVLNYLFNKEILNRKYGVLDEVKKA